MTKWFQVWGLGFGVWGSGIRVQSLPSDRDHPWVRFWGMDCGVRRGLGFRD